MAVDMKKGLCADTEGSVCIYPCSEDTLPLIRQLLRSGIGPERVQAVVFSGMGVTGRDIACLANDPPTGIPARSDFGGTLSSCGCLLIPSAPPRSDSSDPAVRTALSLAREQKKPVFCAYPLPEEEAEAVRSAFQAEGVPFHYLAPERPDLASCLSPTDLQYLYHPEVPVMMAGGLFDCPDNLEILLGLGEKLRREGYRVSGVLSAPEGALWGFHAYPRGFLGVKEGAAAETLYLSHYMQYLIQEENPDVFLVQIPGGALKYSERIPNDFGICAYLLSQFCQPDFYILSMPVSNGYEALLERSLQHLQNVCGFTVDAVHLTNRMVEEDYLYNTGKLEFLHHSQELTDRQFRELKDSAPRPMYRLTSEEAFDRLYRQLVDKLG